jgi:glycerophosphodiester phosphodiesterase
MLHPCGADLLTLQFLYAGRTQGSPGRLIPLPSHPRSYTNDTNHAVKRQRAKSLTQEEGSEVRALQDRMKYTFDFSDKGFKPNTRGSFIQEQFATLEGLLRDLPEHIKLDIEVSMYYALQGVRSKILTGSKSEYPRVHETFDADLAPIALDINLFVDKTLDKLHEFGGSRVIILSSFSPEVCILLKLKQRKYPVMFITNAGKPPDKDKEVRTASLQAAVHFAHLWRLSGVCFDSEALILCPRLIGYTKSLGLGCASYGPLNNVPENANVSRDGRHLSYDDA